MLRSCSGDEELVFHPFHNEVGQLFGLHGIPKVELNCIRALLDCPLRDAASHVVVVEGFTYRVSRDHNDLEGLKVMP